MSARHDRNLLDLWRQVDLLLDARALEGEIPSTGSASWFAARVESLPSEPLPQTTPKREPQNPWRLGKDYYARGLLSQGTGVAPSPGQPGWSHSNGNNSSLDAYA